MKRIFSLILVLMAMQMAFAEVLTNTAEHLVVRNVSDDPENPEEGSLRWCINHATPGKSISITFDIPGDGNKVIKLKSEFVIDRASVTIDASDYKYSIIIDGWDDVYDKKRGNGIVLTNGENNILRLSNINFRNFDLCIYTVSGGYLSLNHCDLCKVVNAGSSPLNLNCEYCNFDGDLRINNGNANFKECDFHDNFIVSPVDLSNIVVEGCNFLSTYYGVNMNNMNAIGSLIISESSFSKSLSNVKDNKPLEIINYDKALSAEYAAPIIDNVSIKDGLMTVEGHLNKEIKAKVEFFYTTNIKANNVENYIGSCVTENDGVFSFQIKSPTDFPVFRLFASATYGGSFTSDFTSCFVKSSHRFVVTSTDGSMESEGTMGTLRWACANAGSNDTILFDILGKGNKIINGYDFNTVAAVDASSSTDTIIIRGTNDSNGASVGIACHGPFVKNIVVEKCNSGISAHDCYVYKCVARNNENGILGYGETIIDSCYVYGNNIGVYSSINGQTTIKTIKNSVIRNNKDHGLKLGVKLLENCDIVDNNIGAETGRAVFYIDTIRNCWIAGNKLYGLSIDATHLIQNCTIGLTKDESAPYPNGIGVVFRQGNCIKFVDNVISGNEKSGISFVQSGTKIDTFCNNYIGTNRSLSDNPILGNGENGMSGLPISNKFGHNYFVNNKNAGVEFPNYNYSYIIDSCYFGGVGAKAMPNGGDGFFQSSSASSNLKFHNCHFSYNGGSGISVTSDNSFYSCEFKENKVNGIYLRGKETIVSYRLNVSKSVFEKNGGSAILAEGNSSENCYFSENQFINTEYENVGAKAIELENVTATYRPEILKVESKGNNIYVTGKVGDVSGVKIELFVSDGKETALELVDSTKTDNSGEFVSSFSIEKISGLSEPLCITATATYDKSTGELSDPVCCNSCLCSSDIKSNVDTVIVKGSKFENKIFNELGRYDTTITRKTSAGCDSVVTYSLFVIPDPSSNKYYVKVNGKGDGSTWSKAMSNETFFAILPHVKDGTTFYLAKGEYYNETPFIERNGANEFRYEFNYVVNKDVTIIGGYSENPTDIENPDPKSNETTFICASNGLTSFFRVNPGAKLTVKNVYVRGKNKIDKLAARSPFYVDNASLIIENSVVYDSDPGIANHTSCSCAWIVGDCEVSFIKSIFKDNASGYARATGVVGFEINSSGNINFSECSFENNSIGNSFINLCNENIICNIDKCSFVNNKFSEPLITVVKNASLKVTNSTFIVSPSSGNVDLCTLGENARVEFRFNTIISDPSSKGDLFYAWGIPKLTLVNNIILNQNGLSIGRNFGENQIYAYANMVLSEPSYNDFLIGDDPSFVLDGKMVDGYFVPNLDYNGGSTKCIAVKSETTINGENITETLSRSDPKTDQRGYSRNSKTCVGAVEKCTPILNEVKKSLIVGSEFLGKKYSTLGRFIAEENLKTSMGCDSVVRYKLNILPNPTVKEFYVKEKGSGDGSSWDKAMSPKTFSYLFNNIEIDDVTFYIAGGTYYPYYSSLGEEMEESKISASSFFSSHAISIIGGYDPDAKGNASTTEPNFAKFPTTISGDFANDDKIEYDEKGNVILQNQSEDNATSLMFIDALGSGGVINISNIIFKGSADQKKGSSQTLNISGSGSKGDYALFIDNCKVIGCYQGISIYNVSYVSISNVEMNSIKSNAFNIKYSDNLAKIENSTFIHCGTGISIGENVEFSVKNSTFVDNINDLYIDGYSTISSKMDLVNNTFVSSSIYGSSNFNAKSYTYSFTGNLFLGSAFKFDDYSIQPKVTSKYNLYGTTFEDEPSFISSTDLNLGREVLAEGFLDGVYSATNKTFKSNLIEEKGKPSLLALLSNKLSDGTSLTFPLKETSVTKDQRGSKRSDPTCMGAYELGCTSVTKIVNDTIIIGTKYPINDSIYTKYGVQDTVVENLQSREGCDSIVKHALVVKPDPTITKYYVKEKGTGDGYKWSTAMNGDNFERLLPLVENGVTFYFAAGTYTPVGYYSTQNEQYKYYGGYVANSVINIYGGYPRDAKDGDTPDPLNNKTIFNGDVNGDDEVVFDNETKEVKFLNREDNIKSVFFVKNLKSLVKSDKSYFYGFTVKGGANDGLHILISDFYDIKVNTVNVINCNFESNYNGLNSYPSYTYVENCSFSYNSCGVYSYNSVSHYGSVKSCCFYKNFYATSIGKNLDVENSTFVDCGSVLFPIMSQNNQIKFNNNTLINVETFICNGEYITNIDFLGNIIDVNDVFRLNGESSTANLKFENNLFSSKPADFSFVETLDENVSVNNIFATKSDDFYSILDGTLGKDGLFIPNLDANGGYTSCIALKSDLLGKNKLRFPRLENVTEDQRGVKRLDLTCMGSYEITTCSDTTFFKDTVIVGEQWHDTVFAAVGIHDSIIETFTLDNGCDSVAFHNVFVKPDPTKTEYFVKMEKKGLGDGSSWDDPMDGDDFAACLSLVPEGTTFYVAEGTYHPIFNNVLKTPNLISDRCYTINNSVTISGGYSNESTGKTLNSNPTKYPTIFSGENDLYGSETSDSQGHVNNLFYVNELLNVSLTFKGVTLEHANDLIVSFFNNTILDLNIYNSSLGNSTFYGIHLQNVGSMNVDHCEFHDLKSKGISLYANSLKIKNTSFYDNKVDNLIEVYDNNAAHSFEFDSLTFKNNITYDELIESNVEIDITNSNFVGNISEDFLVDYNLDSYDIHSIKFANCSFIGNKCGVESEYGNKNEYARFMDLSNSNLYIDNCKFTDNRFGGCIVNSNSVNVNVSNSVFENNYSGKSTKDFREPNTNTNFFNCENIVGYHNIYKGNVIGGDFYIADKSLTVNKDTVINNLYRKYFSKCSLGFDVDSSLLNKNVGQFCFVELDKNTDSVICSIKNSAVIHNIGCQGTGEDSSFVYIYGTRAYFDSVSVYRVRFEDIITSSKFIFSIFLSLSFNQCILSEIGTSYSSTFIHIPDASATFENSTFHHNKSNYDFVYAPYGTVKMVNNSVLANHFSSIISTYPASSVYMYNNTFVGNQVNSDLFKDESSRDFEFAGNVVWGNACDDIKFTYVENVKNNIFQNPKSDIDNSSLTDNNVFGDLTKSYDGLLDESTGAFIPKIIEEEGFTPVVPLLSYTTSEGNNIRFPRLENVTEDQRGVKRLDLTCMGSYEITTCSDTTFFKDTVIVGEQWHDTVFAAVGIHDSIIETFTLDNGCDSIAFHRVLVKPDPTKTEYFVKMEKKGLGDGSSWDDPMDGGDFAAYLPLVPDGVTFYIAEGVYHPKYDANLLVPSINSYLTYKLNSDVTIRGGFSDASEGTILNSDPKRYHTIFDGDIDGDDVIDETLDADGYPSLLRENVDNNVNEMFLSLLPGAQKLTFDGIVVKNTKSYVFNILNDDKSITLSNDSFVYNNSYVINLPSSNSDLDISYTNFSKNRGFCINTPAINNVNLDHVSFESNLSDLLNTNGSNDKFGKVTMDYVKADKNKGVFRVIKHNLTVDNSEFSNSTVSNGLIYFDGNVSTEPYPVVSVSNSSFIGNASKNVLFATVADLVDVDNCYFDNNETGSLLYFSYSNDINITKSTFEKNEFLSLFLSGKGSVLVDSCIVEHSTITESLFDLSNFNGTVKLSNCQIDSNNVHSDLFKLFSSSELFEVSNNSIFDNKAGNLFNVASNNKTYFVNNTITRNELITIIYTSSNTNFINNTIIGNSVVTYVIDLTGDALNLYGNILLGNVNTSESKPEMIYINYGSQGDFLYNIMPSFWFFNAQNSGCDIPIDDSNIISFANPENAVCELHKNIPDRNKEILTTLFEGTFDDNTGLFSPKLVINDQFTPVVALKSDRLKDGKSIRFPRFEDVAKDQRGVSRLDKTCMGSFELVCEPVEKEIFDTVLVGTPYELNDNDLSDLTAKVGVKVYNDTLRSAAGCDSIVNLHLVVRPVKREGGYYVKVNGTGDGSDWENALSAEDFSNYVALAYENDTFRIAEGTYKSEVIDSVLGRGYFVNSSIALIGGYPDTANLLSTEPNPEIFITKLSAEGRKKDYATYYPNSLDMTPYSNFEDNDSILIYVNENTKLSLYGLTLSGVNSCDRGVVDMNLGSSLEMERCLVESNVASAVRGTGADVKVVNSIFTHNYSNRGAAFDLVDSKLEVKSSSVFENMALDKKCDNVEAKGGVAYLENTTALFENNTLSNNAANMGGAFCIKSADLNLINNTLIGNQIIPNSKFNGSVLSSVDGGSSVSLFGNLIVGNSAVEFDGLASVKSSDYNVFSSKPEFTTGEHDMFMNDLKDVMSIFDGEFAYGSETIFIPKVQYNGGFTPSVAVYQSTFDGGEIQIIPADVRKVDEDQRGFNRKQVSCVGSFEFPAIMDYYVKQHSHGDGSGIDWDNAMSDTTFAKYFSIAPTNATFHIAEGVYHPMYDINGKLTTSLYRSFSSSRLINLDGGYPDNAKEGSVADPTKYKTVLSVDFNNNDVYTLSANDYSSIDVENSTDNGYNIVNMLSKTSGVSSIKGIEFRGQRSIPRGSSSAVNLSNYSSGVSYIVEQCSFIGDYCGLSVSSDTLIVRECLFDSITAYAMSSHTYPHNINNLLLVEKSTYTNSLRTIEAYSYGGTMRVQNSTFANNVNGLVTPATYGVSAENSKVEFYNNSFFSINKEKSGMYIYDFVPVELKGNIFSSDIVIYSDPNNKNESLDVVSDFNIFISEVEHLKLGKNDTIVPQTSIAEIVKGTSDDDNFVADIERQGSYVPMPTLINVAFTDGGSIKKMTTGTTPVVDDQRGEIRPTDKYCVGSIEADCKFSDSKMTLVSENAVVCRGDSVALTLSELTSLEKNTYKYKWIADDADAVFTDTTDFETKISLNGQSEKVEITLTVTNVCGNDTVLSTEIKVNGIGDVPFSGIDENAGVCLNAAEPVELTSEVEGAKFSGECIVNGHFFDPTLAESDSTVVRCYVEDEETGCMIYTDQVVHINTKDEDADPKIRLIKFANQKCNSLPDGMIEFELSQLTEKMTYRIEGPDFPASKVETIEEKEDGTIWVTIDSVKAGVYSIYTTDGCYDYSSDSITVEDKYSIKELDIDFVNNHCYGVNNGEVFINFDIKADKKDIKLTVKNYDATETAVLEFISDDTLHISEMANGVHNLVITSANEACPDLYEREFSISGPDKPYSISDFNVEEAGCDATIEPVDDAVMGDSIVYIWTNLVSFKTDSTTTPDRILKNSGAGKFMCVAKFITCDFVDTAYVEVPSSSEIVEDLKITPIVVNESCYGKNNGRIKCAVDSVDGKRVDVTVVVENLSNGEKTLNTYNLDDNVVRFEMLEPGDYHVTAYQGSDDCVEAPSDLDTILTVLPMVNPLKFTSMDTLVNAVCLSDSDGYAKFTAIGIFPGQTMDVLKDNIVISNGKYVSRTGDTASFTAGKLVSGDYVARIINNCSDTALYEFTIGGTQPFELSIDSAKSVLSFDCREDKNQIGSVSIVCDGGSDSMLVSLFKYDNNNILTEVANEKIYHKDVPETVTYSDLFGGKYMVRMQTLIPNCEDKEELEFEVEGSKFVTLDSLVAEGIGCDAVITPYASGDETGYTFYWTNSISQNEMTTTEALVNAGAGVFTCVAVSNECGFTTDTLMVEVPSNPTVDFTVALSIGNESCFEANNGAIAGEINSGDGKRLPVTIIAESADADTLIHATYNDWGGDDNVIRMWYLKPGTYHLTAYQGSTGCVESPSDFDTVVTVRPMLNKLAFLGIDTVTTSVCLSDSDAYAALTAVGTSAGQRMEVLKDNVLLRSYGYSNRLGDTVTYVARKLVSGDYVARMINDCGDTVLYDFTVEGTQPFELSIDSAKSVLSYDCRVDKDQMGSVSVVCDGGSDSMLVSLFKYDNNNNLTEITNAKIYHKDIPETITYKDLYGGKYMVRMQTLTPRCEDKKELEFEVEGSKFVTLDSLVAEGIGCDAVITPYASGDETGYTFYWTNSISQSEMTTTDALINSGAGVFKCVAVSNECGFTTDTLMVEVPSNPTVDFTVALSVGNESCFEANNGAIAGEINSVDGKRVPVTIVAESADADTLIHATYNDWGGDDNVIRMWYLKPGTYHLTAYQGSTGCVESPSDFDTVVTVLPMLNKLAFLSLDTIQNAVCLSDSDAYATLTAMGASAGQRMELLKDNVLLRSYGYMNRVGDTATYVARKLVSGDYVARLINDCADTVLYDFTIEGTQPFELNLDTAKSVLSYDCPTEDSPRGSAYFVCEGGSDSMRVVFSKYDRKTDSYSDVITDSILFKKNMPFVGSYSDLSAGKYKVSVKTLIPNCNDGSELEFEIEGSDMVTLDSVVAKGTGCDAIVIPYAYGDNTGYTFHWYNSVSQMEYTTTDTLRNGGAGVFTCVAVSNECGIVTDTVKVEVAAGPDPVELKITPIAVNESCFGKNNGRIKCIVDSVDNKRVDVTIVTEKLSDGTKTLSTYNREDNTIRVEALEPGDYRVTAYQGSLECVESPSDFDTILTILPMLNELKFKSLDTIANAVCLSDLDGFAKFTVYGIYPGQTMSVLKDGIEVGNDKYTNRSGDTASFTAGKLISGDYVARIINGCEDTITYDFTILGTRPYELSLDSTKSVLSYDCKEENGVKGNAYIVCDGGSDSMRISFHKYDRKNTSVTEKISEKVLYRKDLPYSINHKDLSSGKYLVRFETLIPDCADKKDLVFEVKGNDVISLDELVVEGEGCNATITPYASGDEEGYIFHWNNSLSHIEKTTPGELEHAGAGTFTCVAVSSQCGTYSDTLSIDVPSGPDPVAFNIKLTTGDETCYNGNNGVIRCEVDSVNGERVPVTVVAESVDADTTIQATYKNWGADDNVIRIWYLKPGTYHVTAYQGTLDCIESSSDFDTVVVIKPMLNELKFIGDVVSTKAICLSKYDATAEITAVGIPGGQKLQLIYPDDKIRELPYVSPRRVDTALFRLDSLYYGDFTARIINGCKDTITRSFFIDGTKPFEVDVDSSKSLLWVKCPKDTTGVITAKFNGGADVSRYEFWNEGTGKLLKTGEVSVKESELVMKYTGLGKGSYKVALATTVPGCTDHKSYHIQVKGPNDVKSLHQKLDISCIAYNDGQVSFKPYRVGAATYDYAIARDTLIMKEHYDAYLLFKRSTKETVDSWGEVLASNDFAPVYYQGDPEHPIVVRLNKIFDKNEFYYREGTSLVKIEDMDELNISAPGLYQNDFVNTSFKWYKKNGTKWDAMNIVLPDSSDFDEMWYFKAGGDSGKPSNDTLFKTPVWGCSHLDSFWIGRVGDYQVTDAITVANLAPSWYKVVFNDSVGCVYSDSFEVKKPVRPLQIDSVFFPAALAACDPKDRYMVVYVDGGWGDYNYSVASAKDVVYKNQYYDGYIGGNYISNDNIALKGVYRSEYLLPGDYSITVVDAKGCFVKYNDGATISVTSTLEGFSDTVNVKCPNGNNAEVIVNLKDDSKTYSGLYRVEEYTSNCTSAFGDCERDGHVASSVLKENVGTQFTLNFGNGTHGLFIYRMTGDTCGTYMKAVVTDTIPPMKIQMEDKANVTCGLSDSENSDLTKDGWIKLSVNGGTAPYTLYRDKKLFGETLGNGYTNFEDYDILNADGNVIRTVKTIKLDHLEPGSYYFSVVDANKCNRYMGEDEGAIDTVIELTAPKPLAALVASSSICPQTGDEKLASDVVFAEQSSSGAVFSTFVEGGTAPYKYSVDGHSNENVHDPYLSVEGDENSVFNYHVQDSKGCVYDTAVKFGNDPIHVDRIDFMASTYSKNGDIVALIDFCGPKDDFDSVRYEIGGLHAKQFEILDKRMYIYDIANPKPGCQKAKEALNSRTETKDIPDGFFSSNFNLKEQFASESMLYKHINFIRVSDKASSNNNNAIWRQCELTMYAYFKGCRYTLEANGINLTKSDIIVSGDDYDWYKGGVVSNKDILEINVSPNPFVVGENNNVTVDITFGAKVDYDIYIYSMNGELSHHVVGKASELKSTGIKDEYSVSKTLSASDLNLSQSQAFVVLVQTRSDSDAVVLLVNGGKVK